MSCRPVGADSSDLRWSPRVRLDQLGSQLPLQLCYLALKHANKWGPSSSLLCGSAAARGRGTKWDHKIVLLCKPATAKGRPRMGQIEMSFVGSLLLGGSEPNGAYRFVLWGFELLGPRLKWGPRIVLLCGPAIARGPGTKAVCRGLWLMGTGRCPAINWASKCIAIVRTSFWSDVAILFNDNKLQRHAVYLWRHPQHSD